ncbi:hypothetical protein RhiJN_08216 [Ceratobasidium sp. AG-Ba]|nr:hypothetical protein RhiJN_08216 [Ceratobasidium sp. AG-Ba]QRW08999.1 hypothetical protein RhiLY_07998 [Ceratobasidium sp. AG-Ba]
MPPLPGLTEIEESVKAWIDTMKTQGYNDEECRWLSDRIERLLSVVQSFDESQYTEFSLTAKAIYEIHEAFEKESRATWKSGMLNAERRQRMIRDLNHRIDNVVEASLIDTVHKSLQTRNIDNFTTINAYEISDQTVLYTTNERKRTNLRPSYSQDDASIVVCTRRGQYGKIKVIYRSYTSRSVGNLATQAAEQDLKLLSSLSHPNIAPIVGVTRGYYGLNGYAVLGGTPLKDYWPMLNDGITIARILRGLSEAENSGLLTEDMDIHFIVDARGDVMAVPTRNSSDSSFRDHQRENTTISCRLGFFQVMHHWGLNPVAHLAAGIYQQSYHTGAKLIDTIEVLGQSRFSELNVARIAAELRLLSRVSELIWEGHAPSAVVKCGEIGYIAGANTEDLGWDVIVENCAVDTYYHSPCPQTDICRINHYRSTFNFKNEDWQKAPSGRWISFNIANTPLSRICWTSPFRGGDLYSAGERARSALGDRNIDINRACYCDSIFCSVQVDQSGDEMTATGSLYFHRNPSSSDPQTYWGFLSTSSNPGHSEAVISDYRNMLKYDICFHMVRFLDLWEHKYNQMVQEELDSMPGSYPDDDCGGLSAAGPIVDSLGFHRFLIA